MAAVPTDAQLIAEWGGRCARSNELARFTFHGGATMVTRAALIDVCRALNTILERWHYRARPGCGTGSFNCRTKTGGNGLSIHGLGAAWDINPCQNPFGARLVTDMPAGMIAEILGIRFNNGRQAITWGGNWRGNKDAMHFQIAGLPSDVATGINWATVPGARLLLPTKTPATAAAPEEDDESMDQIIHVPGKGIFHLSSSPAAKGPVFVSAEEANEIEQKVKAAGGRVARFTVDQARAASYGIA